jgi:hypothetical protein
MHLGQTNAEIHHTEYASFSYIVNAQSGSMNPRIPAEKGGSEIGN